MIWWIGGGLLAVVLIYSVVTYNRLIGLSKRADAAWSDIDVQLKRRWDLVPSLVETVKGYARHESTTLEDVVHARSEATKSTDVAARGRNEDGLSKAVGRLFILAEAYPDLKANESFQNLHQTLVEIENSVQNARRYYNAVVRDLNTLIQGFPSMLIAAAGGFQERHYFQAEQDARDTPQVSFDAGAGQTATKITPEAQDQ